MRRAVSLAVLTLLVAGLGVWTLRPQWLRSASDRALRVLAIAAPGLAGQWRQAGKNALSTRFAARGFGLGDPAFIRIFKEENQLEIWLAREGSYQLFETYPICSWSGELGPKLKEGDGQRPEGFYAVGLKQLNPRSAYHLSFDLGFPNAYDRAHGRTGSFLMVHGDCLSVGCYAMGDAGIEDIYRIVEAALRRGQPQVQVQAFPFRLSDAAIAARAGHRWGGEWAGLKEGHDLFEATRTPPQVLICDGQYAFGAPAASPLCTPVRAW